MSCASEHRPEQPADKRPRYEVADVLRLYWHAYCERHKVSAQQRKVVQAILRCRTAALGGHVLACDECGYVEQAYNSCGNRHCPKCQYRLKEQWVTGMKAGRPRRVYLYQVADNETCMKNYGVQAVVWQTAVNPVIAMELLESGVWEGRGVLGPEAFDPDPFVELMPKYDFPYGIKEM